MTHTYEGKHKTEGNGAQLHLSQQGSAGWGPGALGSLQLCHTHTMWRATSLDLCFCMWKWRTSASLPLTFWEAGQGGRASVPCSGTPEAVEGLNPPIPDSIPGLQKVRDNYVNFCPCCLSVESMPVLTSTCPLGRGWSVQYHLVSIPLPGSGCAHTLTHTLPKPCQSLRHFSSYKNRETKTQKRPLGGALCLQNKAALRLEG